MGGRGSTSGMSGGSNSVRGITVKINGESTDYYFTTRNGTHYYQRGIEGMPNPTPQNMTMNEFRQRVEKNGADVKAISEEKRRKAEKEYKKWREEMEKDLDRLWVRGAGRPRKGWRGH